MDFGVCTAATLAELDPTFSALQSVFDCNWLSRPTPRPRLRVDFSRWQDLRVRSEPHFNSLFAHFLAFREYELLDMKDIKGGTNASVGTGLLWDKWKEMGILEG